MDYIVLVFVAIIGLILGSFMSVIVARLDNKSGILIGRSECPKCLVQLRWYDLVPLFSFLILGGKCRYCKEKISFIYPIMELSMAGSLLLYYWFNGPFISWEIIHGFIVIFILLALAFFDYKHYILPDKLMFTGLAVSLAYLIFIRPDVLLGSILTGFGLAGFFAIIYLVSRGEWMGFGDVKLVLLVGFILGYPAGLLSIIAAVWAGAIFGIALMVIGRANLKTALPFGSFICGVSILFFIFNNYVKILLSGL